jgi:transcriptional regulator with XRE-family HTH domain
MISPVRVERNRLGLGVGDLAAICGLSPSTISLVEHGKLPRLPSRLEAGLLRLGVNVTELRVRYREFVEQRRRELELQAIQASCKER